VRVLLASCCRKPSNAIEYHAAHGDAAAGRCELDGVAGEVPEDLLHALRVDAHPGRPGADVEHHGDAFGVGDVAA